MTQLLTPPSNQAQADQALADHGQAAAQLRAEVSIAARLIAPVWPLDRFIAVNPLGGLQDRPFAEALRIAGEAFGARGTLTEAAYREHHRRGRITGDDLRSALADRLDLAGAQPVLLAGRPVACEQLLLCDLLHSPPASAPQRSLLTRSQQLAPALAAQVDATTSKWCAAYFGAHTQAWRPPAAASGLYAVWTANAPSDRAIPAAARRLLRALPAAADEALLRALRTLGVSEGERGRYLQAHLCAMPGWSGHVRWHAEHHGTGDLTELLALRVTLEAALMQTHQVAQTDQPTGDDNAAGPMVDRVNAVAAAAGIPGRLTVEEHHRVRETLERLSPEDRLLIWQRAFEMHYRDELLGNLRRPAIVKPRAPRPLAQVVCCIDTRSEGLRRQLEQIGAYETFGFAGFFAVAIEYQDLAAGQAQHLCPALIKPKNTVREVPHDARASDRAVRYLRGRRAASALRHSYHVAKHDAAAPLVLAETGGWIAGPRAAAKTFAAGTYGAVAAHLSRPAGRVLPTAVTVDDGFSAEEQALTAEVALRMMGLTDNFAPQVVLCGHGSRTDNNPYAAALDCGACGGHSGAPNARTAATILNSADVRAHLRERGINVPSDTTFIAAEHETTADRVELLDLHLLSTTQRAAARLLQEDLTRAGARLSAERCRTLPGAPKSGRARHAARHVRSRGHDWAQVYPEWGLAGNAAFIVAPRSVTKTVDLGRRVFLHSYDPAADPEGAGLETILTAPLVVAQWINAQYYFSSVDPDVYGAGTKTIHNVVGGIGVLSGPGGDLRRGLPWQSVGHGDDLIHEPMRLLAVVQAPLDTIAQIVSRNPGLAQLVDHGWIDLVARTDEAQPWHQHRHGSWQPLASTTLKETR